MASVYNTSIAQGETLIITKNILNANGTAKDLTGYSINSAMEGLDGAIIVLSASIINAAAGTVNVTASSTVTSALKTGQYQYDAYLTDVALNRNQAIKGTITVTLGIAK